MRTMVLAAIMFAVAASPARAQAPYPVAIGLGGGIQGDIGDYHHGMAVVTVTPAGSPIALRLDGVMGKRGLPTVTALSASAVITLRPWRVAPYLVVGASRTTAEAYSYNAVSGGTAWRRSVTATDLTGGLGLKLRSGRTTMFAEMRSLGAVGTPLTVGFTF